MATVSPSPATNRLTSFPLETPRTWVRRREAPKVSHLLPYFIAGDENRLAAFVALADVSTLELGNPLLLIGPSGVGKSALAIHLAARLACRRKLDLENSAGLESSNSEPSAVLHYTAVDFARAYALAVEADDLQPLREQMHQADVVVIDDLHLIHDKPAAQDELALRIDNRVQRDQPTILTCCRLPAEVRGIRPLLASRAVPGLTISLTMPAAESRRQLIRELSDLRGLELDDELVELLLRQIDTRLPPRSLDAAVKQIDLWCRMHDKSASREAVESAIETVGKAEEISLAKITAAVAKYFRLRRADLRSSSRKQMLVRARSLAMLLARRLTSRSMHQIGDYFGGRDHTTVLHAIRKTESLLELDIDLRRAADEIQEKLTAP